MAMGVISYNHKRIQCKFLQFCGRQKSVFVAMRLQRFTAKLLRYIVFYFCDRNWIETNNLFVNFIIRRISLLSLKMNHIRPDFFIFHH